jgi:hypothetical protein
MRWVLVELDDGTQEFFDALYDGLAYARKIEDRRAHSVEHVIVVDGVEHDEQTFHVYKGQELRYLLRALDNTYQWLKTTRLVDMDDSVQGLD